jgi:cytochrome b561
MALKNANDKFGSLTKLLHWTIFVLFIVQFYLVYRREYFPKESAEKLQYLLLHESIGVCLLLLALLMLVWRYAGTRPAMPMNMTPFEIFAAKSTHFLLYLLMLVQPITGISMSMLAGYKVGVFGWFNLPTLLAKNEHIGHYVYKTHVWCSYLIIALVSLHLLGSLYHHFIKRDKVLLRMLPGN